MVIGVRKHRCVCWWPSHDARRMGAQGWAGVRTSVGDVPGLAAVGPRQGLVPATRS